jgi:hypothetical protein
MDEIGLDGFVYEIVDIETWDFGSLHHFASSISIQSRYFLLSILLKVAQDGR